MSVKYLAEYIGVEVLKVLVNVLPLKAALAFGTILGDLLFYVIGIRKKVVFENLKRAFKDKKSDRELKDIARRTYRNFSQTLIEFFRLPYMDEDELYRTVSFVNFEKAKEAASLKRGVILVMGHFGNWEITGAAICNLGYPLSTLTAPMKNELVDRIVVQHRKAVGFNVIPRGSISVKEVFKALRRGEFVGFLSDQDAGPDGVFVNFFEKCVSAPPGPAAIALKRNIPIVLCFPIRQKGGRHRVIVEGPIYPSKFRESEDGIRELTQKYTSLLEDYIRKYPDHWLWMHRRWKSSRQQTVDSRQGTSPPL